MIRSDIREASIEPGPELRLPGGVAAQVGPFAVLAAAALWLRAHFDDLPARLPVHWNVHGQADRFVERRPLGASFPLLLGAALCLLTLGVQLAIRRSSPRGTMRGPTLRVLLAVEYFVALLNCGVLAATATNGRLLAPVLVFSVAAVVVLVVVTALAVRGVPREPVRNPNAWRAGVFYFDRHDPALLVPKRSGVGYTFNFAHPAAVLLTLLILLLPMAIALFALSVR